MNIAPTVPQTYFTTSSNSLFFLFLVCLPMLTLLSCTLSFLIINNLHAHLSLKVDNQSFSHSFYCTVLYVYCSTVYTHYVHLFKKLVVQYFQMLYCPLVEVYSMHLPNLCVNYQVELCRHTSTKLTEEVLQEVDRLMTCRLTRSVLYRL